MPPSCTSTNWQHGRRSPSISGPLMKTKGLDVIEVPLSVWLDYDAHRDRSSIPRASPLRWWKLADSFGARQLGGRYEDIAVCSFCLSCPEPACPPPGGRLDSHRRGPAQLKAPDQRQIPLLALAYPAGAEQRFCTIAGGKR